MKLPCLISPVGNRWRSTVPFASSSCFGIFAPRLSCSAEHETLAFYVTTPGKKTLVVGVRLQLGTSHRMGLCETAGAMYVVWSRGTFWLQLGRDGIAIGGRDLA